MTTVNRIEILEDGTIQVRLSKTAAIGHEQRKEAWGNHRAAAEPGADLGKLFNTLNDHFGMMGVVPITSAEWTKITGHAGVAWTPKVISDFQEAREARVARGL